MTRVSPFPVAETLIAPTAPPEGSVLLTLLRGWPRIVVSTLLALACAAVWAFGLAVPTYRSTVTLMLEPQEPALIDLAVVLPSLGRDSQILNSQVEVLRSRLLIGSLVDDLGLTQDPEFNPTLRQPHPYDPRPRLRAQLQDWRGTHSAPPPDAETQRNRAIDFVLRRLEIAIEPESLVLTVSASTREAEKSALMVNRLAALYLAEQLSAKRTATEDATLWLTGRVVELKAALEAAEQTARTARAETTHASPEAIAEMERRLAALRAREANVRAGTPAQTALEAEIALVMAEIQSASDASVLQAQLDRDVAATAILYETFLSRLKETSIQDGAHRPDVRILSPAVKPRQPHSPNVPLILALAVILGAGFGGLWTLLREEWRLRFRTLEEVERATGLPVLAALPEVADDRRDPLHELTRQPNSPAAEAVRTLRSAVLLSNIDAPPKVVTVTSSVAGEGKTTTTLMLAQTLTSWEKTVLVVEADIRAARFQARFKIPEKRGLLSVLAGLAAVEDITFRPPGMGFDVIPGEASASHAADVFTTGRFASFIKEMRGQYDYVLIDTPPVLAAADARVIGRVSDLVLYLYRWNRTSSSQLRRGLGLFRSFGQPVAGIAMTRMRRRGFRSYASGRG